jgi:hypothetical protein
MALSSPPYNAAPLKRDNLKVESVEVVNGLVSRNRTMREKTYRLYPIR